MNKKKLNQKFKIILKNKKNRIKKKKLTFVMKILF